MNDIVERLRYWAAQDTVAAGSAARCEEAADEITRLRAELKQHRLAVYEASKMMGAESCEWDDINGWHEKHDAIIDAALDTYEPLHKGELK